MWNILKKLFKGEKPQPTKQVDEKPVSKTKKKSIELSDKEKATAAGEPYISIVKMEVDPNDVNNGAFEFDWNDKFIINLIKSGYKIRQDDTDSMLVDRWFQSVCRNVALEIYEQQQADPDNREMRVVRTRDIGDGRTEIS
jgi:hypothetical protein